jgi:tyrosinase
MLSTMLAISCPGTGYNVLDIVILNMVNFKWCSLLLLSPLVAAESQHDPRQAVCTTKVAHKPWGMLTSAEKTAYIDAELCLMKAPSKLKIAGAETRWDDIHHNHIVQAHVIHDVGHFLPWHRLYVAVHGNILRDECGYKGPLPYWDETADASLSNLNQSEVFQATAFGGNGVGQQNYINNGPFASTTLRLKKQNQAPSSYRISRNLNVRSLASARASALNTCFQMSTYAAAWECWAGAPHGAGHGAVGGLMIDVSASPGDPVFYLHHGWLDAMWWKWQTLDLPARLTDIGGRNLPQASYVRRLGLNLPGPEWTNYHGETGSVTTLKHVLFNAGLAPNATVGDVMDVRTGVICAEYFYSDSFNVTINTIVDGIMQTESF